MPNELFELESCFLNGVTRRTESRGQAIKPLLIGLFVLVALLSDVSERCPHLLVNFCHRLLARRHPSSNHLHVFGNAPGLYKLIVQNIYCLLHFRMQLSQLPFPL